MIHAAAVTVKIGSKTLVNSVDFNAPPGKVTAIIGPNGAGKSSFLKVLAGETEPENGVVEILGNYHDNWKRQDIAQLRAVLPQSSSLNFAFQVRDVVRLGRLPFGETRHCDDLIRNALQEVGLLGFERRLYTELSGGEQRRVQFARVLTQIHEAAGNGEGILLLDEPTANLDPAHAFSVLRTAHKLSRQGLTVVTVVHDVNFAAPFADYFVGMNAGKIMFSGPTDDVLNAGNLKALYGIDASIYPHPVSQCPQVAFHSD